MSKNEFQVVSAPFASGVSLLVSIFLELNIKMTSMAPQFENDQWRDIEGESVLSENPLKIFKNYFSILSRKANKFTFDNSIEGFWEHRLDSALHINRPTILFIRDPRDAIFSLYRRNYSLTMSFEEYLLTPSCWPDHFPDMFGVPPFETWAYYNLFWYNLRHHINLKIVTFEAMKARPEEEVVNILKFLGIEKNIDQIRLAVNNSSLASLSKTIDHSSVEQNSQGKLFLKGEVGEWKRHYTSFQKSFFDTDLVSRAMGIFGYKANEPYEETNTPIFKLCDTGYIENLISLALNKSNIFQFIPEIDKLLVENRLDFVKYLHLLAAKKAIIWFRLITSGKIYERGITLAMIESLYTINKYLYIKHLFPVFNESDPYNASIPLLIEEGFDGFAYNIIKLGRRYWALPQDIGPIDLQGSSGYAILREYLEQGKCYTGESFIEVKNLVRVRQQKP